jgi:hypothetical protein
MMGIGFPSSVRFKLIIDLVESDTRPSLRSRKPEPCNLSTTTPLVINLVINLVDLTKKANPCL